MSLHSRQITPIVFISLFVSSTPAAIDTLSTGIGSDEREQAHPEYTLKLEFFVETGAYLADIDVTIRTVSGEHIITTNSYGPWLFVKLDNGDYVVTATRKNGDKQSDQFTISTNIQTKVSLRFPDR